MRVAVVGSGLAGFTAYQTLRRELAPGEIAVFGTDADPAAAWRVRAAAIRQREMRSESDGHCLRDLVPGARVLERPPPPLGAAAARFGARPLSPDGGRVPLARRAAPGAERLGREPDPAPDRARASGRRRLRPRRGALPARAPRARPSGAERPGGAARRPAGRPLVRAARLRGHGHGGRCGPRRGDRVAERARGGRRGGVGAPARAGATPAQRPAPLLLPPRPRRLPPPRAARAGRAPAHADRRRPTRRAPSGTSRSSARLARGGSAWSSP